jgi:putative GTP pyrophosphokinase
MIYGQFVHRQEESVSITPVSRDDTPGTSLAPMLTNEQRAEQLRVMRWLRSEVPRFQMEYDFAIKEVLTKVTILQEEFMHLHQYNPIEHITSRVKEPDSLLEKIVRKQVRGDFAEIRRKITDIAGVRITCAFIPDSYTVLDALVKQDDVVTLKIKDYIKHPKPNGYRSLHAIIQIPIFMSTGKVDVPVEVQIRTVAMDFWASLEHKIFYKYDGNVPDHVAGDLARAAAMAWELDVKMDALHTEVRGGDEEDLLTDTTNQDLLRRAWDLFRPTFDTLPTDD